MKPVVTRLYAVLVALALVGLIAWSGADWYQRQQLARAQAQTDLRQAAGVISDLDIHQRPLTPEALNAAFIRTGADHRWKTIVLSSPERGTEYYRGPRPAVPMDQEVPRWQPREWSEVKVSLPVFRSQGAPMVLEGIYEFYGRAEVFSLFKASGLTLVVLVVFTAGMVYWASRGRKEDPLPEAPQEASPWDQGEEPPLEETESLDFEPPTETTDEYWFDESLTLDDLPPLEDMPAFEEKAADDEDLTFEEVKDAGPSLFSPATGMGWETFLKTRLDHELQRCAGSNQDLSLVLLAIKEGEVAPEAWGQAVREAFPSVDLDFEYEGGAAVVLPGTTLEQALKAARAFVETTDRRGAAVVHAGVASRGGRLLSAETLLTEAGSAKRRSLAGTVRVLGLKTDPDRYREHLAAQGPAL